MDNIRLLIDFGSTFTKVVAAFLVKTGCDFIIGSLFHPLTLDVFYNNIRWSY